MKEVISEIIDNSLISDAIRKDNKHAIVMGSNISSFNSFRKEKDIIKCIEKEISSVKIPKNVELIFPSKSYKYGAFKYDSIEGTLLTEDNIKDIDINKIGYEIAKFLNELHLIDIKKIDKSFYKERLVFDEKKKINENIDLLNKYLNVTEKFILNDFKNNYFKMIDSLLEFHFIHGCLGLNSIILNEELNEITGVINFKESFIFDNALELVSIKLASVELYNKVLEHYNYRSVELEERIKLYIVRKEIIEFKYVTEHLSELEIKEKLTKIISSLRFKH